MPKRSIKRPSDIKLSAKILISSLALLPALTGFMQLIGWLSGNAGILTLWRGTALMSFNTSLSMVLVGLGISFLLSKKTEKMALSVGLIVFFISSLALVKSITGAGFALDDLVYATAQNLNLISVTSTFTATALLFASLAVIMHETPWAREIPIQIGLVGAVVTAIGTASLVSHILELRPRGGPTGLGTVAISTALAIFLLGTALITIEDKRYPPKDHSWIPPTVGTFAFSIALIMWQSLKSYEAVSDNVMSLFLGGGIILAFLSSVASYFVLMSRKHLDLVLAKENELMQMNEQLEARVRERTQELANSNAELERFAYMAAHDLKSPLNSMTQFAEVLQEELGPRLNDEEKEYLAFINQAGERARRMIDSLLEYARVGGRPQRFEKLDMNSVANTAAENLSFDASHAHAEIIIQALPFVCGDRIQMTQLFQNLLANAIKFRKPQQKPSIRISVKEEGTKWIFAIADNGIGIEPKHLEKVFELFSRFHKEYQGTGLGLAMCRKIVENHFGRIWVESKVGEGTTFYFSLPKIGSPESPCQ